MNRIIRNKQGLAWVLSLLFTACSPREIFSDFYSFSQDEWPRNEEVNFLVSVEDVSSQYDIFLEIRNNNHYPFRNIWLFVDLIEPDGKQRKDTVNAELTDVYGKWYGTGISLYTYSFPYETNVKYPVSGIYTYSIRQGMREEMLQGIADIGLTVVSVENRVRDDKK